MPGTIPLREALAMKIERLYGHRYDPATEITVTSGATEALYATLTALVHPGDEVLLFQPAYDSYVPAIQLSGGTPVFVTMRPPEYRIDWDAARRALTPRTRAIVINSPHNPTGMILTGDDMRELQLLLEHTDAVVIADEAYEHIVFDGERHESMSRYPAIAERAVVIGSFAKTFTTTGWKVGWLRGAEAAQRGGAEHPSVGHVCGEQRDSARVCRVSAHRSRVPQLGSSTAQARPVPVPDRRAHDSGRCRVAARSTQMVDYSAITTDRDTEVAMWLLKEHGVASIPLILVSLRGRTGAADSPTLFRQAGRDARTRGGASEEGMTLGVAVRPPQPPASSIRADEGPAAASRAERVF